MKKSFFALLLLLFVFDIYAQSTTNILGPSTVTVGTTANYLISGFICPAPDDMNYGFWMDSGPVGGWSISHDGSQEADITFTKCGVYVIRGLRPCQGFVAGYKTVTVTDPTMSNPTASAPAPACSSSNVTLTGSGCTSPSTLVWYDNAAGTGTPVGTGSPIVVTPASTQTYYAFCNNTTTLCRSTTPASVIASILPAPTISAVPLSSCTNNGSFTAVGSPAGGSFTLDGSPSSGTVNPNSLSPGTHTICYTTTSSVNDFTGAFTATSSCPYTSITSTSAQAGSPSSSSCTGTATVTFNYTAPYAGTLTYSLSGKNYANNITVNGAGVTEVANTCGSFSTYYTYNNNNITVNLSAGQTFTVTMSYSIVAGNCPGQGSHVGISVASFVSSTPCSACTNFTINAAPTTPTMNGGSSFCSGGNTTIVLGIANGLNWTLSPAGSASPSSGTSTGAAINVVVNPSGNTTYTLTVTDPATTCTATTTRAITVNPIPAMPANPGDFSVCSGQSVTINSAPGTNGNQVEWVSGSSCNGSFSNSCTFTPSANATVCYRTRNSTTGCVSAQTCSDVTVNPLPTVGVFTGPATSCSGTNVTLSLGIGSGLNWSISPSGSVSPSSGTSTGSTISITANPTGNVTYTVTVVNPSTGCQRTGTRSITVNPNPLAPSNPGDYSICAGQSVTISSAPGTNGNQVEWMSGSSCNGSFSNTCTFTPSANATVCYRSRNSTTGCVSPQTCSDVTVNPLPVVSIAGAGCINQATPFTLTASGATSYIWTASPGPNPLPNNQSSITVNPSVATTYTVVGTSAGCNDAESFTTPTCLPLEFLSFEGELLANGSHHLAWKVAESQVSYYEVERMDRNGEFEKMANLNSSPSSAGHYSHQIQHPQLGISIYRIKAVDMDGSIFYSENTVSLASNSLWKLKLYPNPAQDLLNIEVETSGQYEVKIFNSLGELMYFTNKSSEERIFSLDCSNWAAGIYELKIASEYGEEIRKFVVE